MGNAAGSLEMTPGRDVKRPLSTYGHKQPPAPKLPPPPEEELEERFNIVLVRTEQNIPLKWSTLTAQICHFLFVYVFSWLKVESMLKDFSMQ